MLCLRIYDAFCLTLWWCSLFLHHFIWRSRDSKVTTTDEYDYWYVGSTSIYHSFNWCCTQYKLIDRYATYVIRPLNWENRNTKKQHSNKSGENLYFLFTFYRIVHNNYSIGARFYLDSGTYTKTYASSLKRCLIATSVFSLEYLSMVAKQCSITNSCAMEILIWNYRRFIFVSNTDYSHWHKICSSCLVFYLQSKRIFFFRVYFGLVWKINRCDQFHGGANISTWTHHTHIVDLEHPSGKHFSPTNANAVKSILNRKGFAFWIIGAYRQLDRRQQQLDHHLL